MPPQIGRKHSRRRHWRAWNCLREAANPLPEGRDNASENSPPHRCGEPSYDRRQALALAAAAAMLSVDPRAGHAGDDAYEAIQRFTAGRAMSPDRVHLDLPDIVYRGRSVRIAVSVEVPGSEAADVTDLLIVADGDPGGRVAQFHFSPERGVAKVTTRIRLHATQHVIAVARMSDGAFYIGRKQVKVALGGWYW